MSTPSGVKPPARELELPVVVGNRYKLLELRGGGGMAKVYRATDLTLEREVAVKLMNPELRVDPEFDARFQREAKIASQLTDPHIVEVYDFGIDADLGPFLVMQFNAQHSYYQEHYRGAAFQVIMHDGQPIGRLYMVRWPDELRIIDIALLSAHRGRGVGTTILGAILAEGRRLGLPVRIHVERFNPALRLYTRLGFRQAADKGVYYLLECVPDAR